MISFSGRISSTRHRIGAAGRVPLMAAVFLLFLALADFSAGQSKTPSPALLVLNKADSTLAIVDPATLKVVAKVETGPTPHEVAASADGKIAITSNYGANRDGKTLTVIDLVKQNAIRQVTFPGLSGPHGIVIRGDKAYFTIEGNKSLGLYDFVAQHLDLLIPIGQNRPHMLVMAKDGRSIYISNIDSDTIAIEQMNMKPTEWTPVIVKVGKAPEGIDLSPDGKEVWAANSGDGTVSIIDTAAQKVSQTFDVQTKHSNRLKFTPDGKLVLISDLATGDLVIV